MASYVSIWENSYIRQFLRLRRPKVRRHKIGPMSSSAFLSPPLIVDGHEIGSVRSCTALSPLIPHVEIYLTHFARLLTVANLSGFDKVERIQICTN